MPRPAPGSPRGRPAQVLRVALRLGLTSFGGPIAHLGYFERVYVRERGWLSAEQYAALVGLCQVLPGPTSSQVGFLIGLHRAGWRGALFAWAGFTLPSALLLYACARLSTQAPGGLTGATVHGLKLVAVAVVAQAVWSMARRLCTDASTALIALGAAALLLVSGAAAAQLAALVAGFAAGLLWCRPANVPPVAADPLAGRAAWLALATFSLLLLALELLAWRYPHSRVALAQVFYRAGALVFGGGHVVLPLLRAPLVPGWLSDDAFLSGYGLAQAVPGPLFTVAVYLGAIAAPGTPTAGALIALVAIFLPGLLLAVAGSSLWTALAHRTPLLKGITGVNAAVVGILAAALYHPVWTGAVQDAGDVAVAAGALALLMTQRVLPWVVVVLCVAVSIVRTLA